MNQSDIKEWYIANFERFENSLNGRREIPFHKTRKAAIARFSELGFPTPRNEEWKYTNVSSLLAHKFKLTTESAKLEKKDIEEFIFPDTQKNLFVFVNGKYDAELSTVNFGDGVIIESLGQAFANHTDLVEQHLGRYADFEKESFTALNTAFTHDGAFIYIPENKNISAPIHVIHISKVSDTAISSPRNLFVIGKNSQVKIVESYHAVDSGIYFTNSVTEIFVDENANVEHIKIQEESDQAFHIANTQIHQERSSVFLSVNIDIGGSFVRNNLNVLLNDENCEAHLFGFFMGFDTQHIDNHTFIDHAKPHCFSNELYKGILDDKARGVFNGKIIVRQDAQKTNALQSNKTLLLTNDASMNSKPQLEIFADDVKCTHGATIGQLDDDALFYLRARGIREELAGAMLRHAFISDVLHNIKIDSIREKMDAHIIDRFTNH